MVIQDANVTLNIPLWKYTRALALSTDSFLWRISHRGSDHRNLKIWRVKYSFTKISERANNTIQKYFVFKHIIQIQTTASELEILIWVLVVCWEDQNIRKLPNQSPSPRALPSVMGNTTVRTRRNTAHCCWWKMIKLKYKLWFPPPAPSPPPCTTLRSRCRMIVSVLKYNQVGEKSYGQQFHFVRGTIYINEMISISERKLICKCGEGWEGRRADGRAEAGRAAVAWFWWGLEFFNFVIDLHL